MSDLLQVTQPIQSQQNYNQSTAARQPVQNDSVFDLVDLSKVIKTADRNQQNSQNTTNLDEGSGGLPRLSMLIAKDPAMASGALRQLLSREVLARVQESGDQRLYDKLTEFAEEIMLGPDELLSDMEGQLKNSTLFQGKLFGMLRQMAGSPSQEMRTAVLALLKNLAAASQGREVLDSLARELAYLSDQMGPSRELSASLAALAQRLASQNGPMEMGAVRAQIQSLIHQISNSLLLTDQVKNMLPLLMHNLSRFSDSPSALRDAFQNLLNQVTNPQTRDALSEAFRDFVAHSKLPPDVKGAIAGTDAAEADDPMGFLAARLADQARRYTASISADALQSALNRLTKGMGTDYANALRQMLGQALPPGASSGLDTLMDAFASDKNLNLLLDQLSTLLNGVERMDVKVPLAQALNSALSGLAEQQGVKYKPPTAMDNLADFMAKNINDHALRSLNGFQQSDLVSSLLTAPGVFTPLLHFLVPMEMDDVRAFGELWVDPDSEEESRSGGDGEAQTHLFLSFSVEGLGDFELEVYADSQKSDLNVSLHTPPQFSSVFTKLKEPIARIAASKGYAVRTTRIEPLMAKRTLLDVFPKLKERRTGLNVAV